MLTNCKQLKMATGDIRNYSMDVACIEQLLRIIIPTHSPKAGPFKLWVAVAGNESASEFPKGRRGDASGFAGHV